MSHGCVTGAVVVVWGRGLCSFSNDKQQLPKTISNYILLFFVVAVF